MTGSAAERFDPRVAVADRRVVRAVGAEQADGVYAALVVAEAEGLTVGQFGTRARW